MNRILSIIVISQFLCTSLWFAGNAILPDLIGNLELDQSFLAHLTSSVQFGFISGTLVFALFAISDRFSPSWVFFLSAMVASLCNFAVTIEGLPVIGLLCFRFSTGFFLAGIYPVGMKIASDYYQKGLGKSLGFLVGALVLGTAFPHLLKGITVTLPWKYVIVSTSVLSIVGGLILVWLVPDGPYRKSGQPLKLKSFMAGFKNKKFRSAALGYFGHMWELYTFWAFVPVMLAAYKIHQENSLNVPIYSFLIIAAGGGACVISGLLSQTFKPKRLAMLALLLSGLCCLLSPLLILHSSQWVFLAFLFFWGLVVIADSPLFSALVAQYSPEESRGTSLTIVNCIGFTITIISIQSINALSSLISEKYIYWVLAIGPIVGLFAMLSDKETPFANNPNRAPILN